VHLAKKDQVNPVIHRHQYRLPTVRKSKPMKANAAVSLVVILVLTCFCSAEAQQTTKAMPRIGFIYSTGVPASPQPWFDAFRQGLHDLGYVEGKNVLFERRYAEGRLDRMPALVKELVQQKIDVIVAPNNVVIRAAKEATKTIPIVMVTTIDPVAAGYVKSFARPGGNITGLSWLSRDLSAKRVELLREFLPKISRVAVLWDADGPGPAIAFKEYEAAARAFNLELRSLEVRGAAPDFKEVLQAAKTAHVEALIVVGNALMYHHAKQIFELTTKNQLPSITEEARYVRAGGLISYGASLNDLYRRAAGYVDRILKGAKPADMLVEQPTAFEIFINLKTAKQIGLEIPRGVLLRANELIE
jgi:putative ABC transport system substrate-binding protein